MARMIPCTDAILERCFTRVMEVMVEHGLLAPSANAKAMAEEAVRVFASQGLTNEHGDMPMGRCLVLLDREGVALLLATPCPADQFDKNLRLQSSPITFRRTDQDEIIVPGQWLLAKLEELSRNPVAPPKLQQLALQLSRHGMLDDILLPPEAETLAVTVQETEGPPTIIEALPAGQVITMRARSTGISRRSGILSDAARKIRMVVRRIKNHGK
jgi:hypothetical protein